jgi:D-tyrosyl-tRNA(Tyr) deacylase
MRAVVQRSHDARVTVDGAVIGSFSGAGLVVLVGVTHDDTGDHAARLADKVYDLRIFGPEHAPEGATEPSTREVSASDLGLPLLVISQFTLYGDTRKGRRPSFTEAARPEVAAPLVDHFCQALRRQGVRTQTGIFAAHMLVEIANDGPVTIWLEK